MVAGARATEVDDAAEAADTAAAVAVYLAAIAPPPEPEPDPLPAPVTGFWPSEAQWAALRRCESGGNYGIVDRSGTYRGAYQFDMQTWRGVGGTGDPAAASVEEQDYRARLLYAHRGPQPWPVCGRYLR